MWGVLWEYFSGPVCASCFVSGAVFGTRCRGLWVGWSCFSALWLRSPPISRHSTGARNTQNYKAGHSFRTVLIKAEGQPSLLCSFTLSIQLCGSEGSFHAWQNPPLWLPGFRVRLSAMLCPIPSHCALDLHQSDINAPTISTPHTHCAKEWRVVWNNHDLRLGDRARSVIGNMGATVGATPPCSLPHTASRNKQLPWLVTNWCYFLWVSWVEKIQRLC